MAARLSRRALLKALAAAGVAGATAGWPQLVAARCKKRILQWRNWSGAQSCIPAERVGPGSEAELADFLRKSRGVIRSVGSGHSFSALVPTDGMLVSLNRLSGLLSHDADALQAEFGAGTLLSQTGAPLKAIGMGMENMSDIDYQTLGGLYATATHGTGIRLGSMSTQIAGLRLVTARGDALDCDAKRQPEIFNAACVSLGALGIVTRFRLQCRPAFRLHEKMWLTKTEDVLADINRHLKENRHFEMQVLTHSDYALAIALNETEAEATGTGDETEEGGNEYVRLIEMLHQYGSDFPGARRAIMNFVARMVDFDERIADSYAIFANVRNVRFNEMEYQVPAEAGPDCLREILKTIRDKNLPTWFPIEYRYVKGDDHMLSQFHGRDSASISIHQYHEMDYHGYFSVIEPIFWKYEGRPHWGKLHSLNAGVLKTLYPRWQDFLAVRQSLDPQGRFLNGHLRSLFGV